MIKDRLKEVPKTNAWPRVSYKRISRQRRSDDVQDTIAEGPLPLSTLQPNDDHDVAQFLAQIDLLSKWIDKIGEFAKEVELIHNKMIEPMADRKLTRELDDKTAEIRDLAYKTSTQLKTMEEAQQEKNVTNQGTAQWRIRELQVFNMTTRFRDTMNRYNQEHVMHRERCKQAIKRELEITGNRRTDDEIEEMIETGFPGKFSLSIMVDVEKARQAASLIEERHRDITKLEASIKELHDMFVDLALLVTAQGEMIDNIENNVVKAVDFVQDASRNVQGAYDNRRAAMKKKMIIIAIILAVILVLILIGVSYNFVQRKLFGK